ncbi:hypothetical protein O181_126332 [Austropuccinia psidii MF-1]|uniref:Tet-like 2OG-Fe(II) oxygenase domain-containing protein n=1 Tax=Austropuccinia psidii MF-1 TaxID=1389203 RepID=A0A9Q3KT68_9BASI|nr:hypothetical protein [Austropuccinia psidii MF-1]
MSHLGHSNKAYKDFSTISIDKKAANYLWLKLPPVNTLPHPYVIIDKTKKQFLPAVIYEITPFDHFSGHSQILKDLIMKLMSLSQNQKEIKTNKQVLGGIMKGIGFYPGSDSGKSAAVYSQKPGLTPHEIRTDNKKWTKIQQYDELIYSRIYNSSKLAENENQSLMEAAKLPNFSQLKWTSANPKQELKAFTNVIVTQDESFNKPHQYLNDINSWTYSVFFFVSKEISIPFQIH